VEAGAAAPAPSIPPGDSDQGTRFGLGWRDQDAYGSANKFGSRRAVDPLTTGQRSRCKLGEAMGLALSWNWIFTRFSARRRELAVMLVLGLAASCAASAQPLRKINIGLSTSSLTVASVRVASEMGLFRKHGLTVTFTMMDSGNGALSGLLGGSFDAVVATSSDIVAARARGQDVIALRSIYNGLGATLILSKSLAEKSGISPSAPLAERLKLLNGLTIAVASPTSGYFLALKGALRTAYVADNYIYAAAAAMPPALATGAVQAYIGSAPFWMRSIVDGSGVVWLSGPKGDFPADSTPATSATLQMLGNRAEADKGLAKALVDVMTEFSAAIDQDPAAVKAATRRLFPELNDQTMDLFFQYESPSWKGGPVTVRTIAHEIAFVQASGAAIPGIDKLDPAAFLLR
jgi:ABC-type nitrate/sulfonate/bicarbonate transport system substrate-binding protein